MKRNPCHKKCERRSEACHAECKEYMEYFNDRRVANEQDLKNNVASNFLGDSYQKTKKKARKR